MTDPDHDLESALAGLRPRPPGPAVTAALARELDPPVSRRGVILAWTAGLTTAAMYCWNDSHCIQIQSVLQTPSSKIKKRLVFTYVFGGIYYLPIASICTTLF